MIGTKTVEILNFMYHDESMNCKTASYTDIGLGSQERIKSLLYSMLLQIISGDPTWQVVSYRTHF